MSYPDDLLKDTLKRARIVAVVGASANPTRPSHFVARYLAMRGYRVIPVNPGLAGQTLLGETVYGSLTEIPDPVDMVDVFRRSDAVPEVVTEALARWPDLQTVWLQIGVTSPEAREMAEARGVRVIEDRCPKIEYERLLA